MSKVRKRRWTTARGEQREAWIVDYLDQDQVRRLKTFQRKKAADAFETKMRTEVQDGTHVADSVTVTLAEAGELWIESGKGTTDLEPLERTTLDQRRQHLDLHILKFMGKGTKLSKVTVQRVRAFQEEMRKNDRSAGMVRRVTISLGALLADAQQRGLISHNPVREMSGRRRKSKQGQLRQKARLEIGVTVPTAPEIAAIIQNAEGRWRPLLILAVYTGLRASEIRGLRWIDVDLKAGKINVRQRVDRYGVFGSPKSDAGQRTIPVGPFVVNTLREWKLKCPSGELDLVFPNGEGNVEWHPNIINRGFVPAQMAAGVSVITNEKDEAGKPILAAKYPGLHALRHFFASWCLNLEKDGGRGLPPKRVQEFMGHSSITMTMDVYGHLFPDNDDGKALADAEQKLLTAVNAT